MNEINFYLPGFYNRSYMNIILYKIMTRYPEYFYDGIKIGAVYGTFPGAIWNGGRTSLGTIERNQIIASLEEFNENNIPCRFTFTNPLIEEKHLYDTYCNLIMELGNNGMNEVLVNSEILEKYIRENYPKYKIISSTTKCINNIDTLKKELEKDYYLVVADSMFNNTSELFTLNHKEKIELIINHYCEDNCPKRIEHYKNVGKCQLEFRESDFPPCKNINRDFYDLFNSHSFITTEKLYDKYINAGFKHFKIDGRAFNPYKLAESYMYYFVKPQYRDSIRLNYLKAIGRFI